MARQGCLVLREPGAAEGADRIPALMAPMLTTLTVSPRIHEAGALGCGSVRKVA